MEQCAAVLAVIIAENITAELDTQLDNISFFTDSKVVMGYIHNEKRRSVQQIRRSTKPEQWYFVPTDNNPADHATTTIPATHPKDTAFLSRPEQTFHKEDVFELVDPEQDIDIRPQVSSLCTTARDSHL